MPRLLALPRELRDQIITYVLLSRPIPNDNNDLTIPRSPIHTWRYMKSVGLSPLMFEDYSFAPSCLTLFLINRQLRDEAMEAINFLPGKGKQFVLDVMFVEERELWPTWACVPIYTKHIELLEANVRIVGAMKEWGAGYGIDKSIWEIGNGAPPAAVWPFFTLLEHVCRRGGSIPHSNAITERTSYYRPIYDEKAPRVTINKLVISFSANANEDQIAGVEEKYIWFQVRRRFRDWGGLEEMQNRVMRPEWLAKYLLDFLQGLLNMTYRMSSYGAFLYNTLDFIVIKTGDQVLESINLGTKLASLEFNDSFGNISRDDREEYFKAWKERTTALRRTKGLSVQ